MPKRRRRSVSSQFWGLMAIWMVVGPALALLAAYVHTGFLIALFALMFLIVTATYRIRCPRCEYPVFVIRRVAGFPLMRNWLPSQCPRCGLQPDALA